MGRLKLSPSTASPVMAVLCTGHQRKLKGSPHACWGGAILLNPCLLLWTPVGNKLLFLFTLLDQLHSFLNIICPILFAQYYLPKNMKKLPHSCQTHFPNSFHYSSHWICHHLHFWSNRNLLVWNANWMLQDGKNIPYTHCGILFCPQNPCVSPISID